MTYTSTTDRIPLTKGWSDDQKFILKNKEGTVLLRILDGSKFNRKAQELEYLSSVDLSPGQFSMSLSVTLHEGKTEFITTYLEGEDLEDLIETLSDDDQIRLGTEAGRALKSLHQQVNILDDGSWEARYRAKIDRKIQSYRDSGVTFPYDDRLIRKIESLKPFLKDRPMVFQHGDYHIGNFLRLKDGHLGILDFDRWDLGDPIEEFNRIVWCREKSTLFTQAMIEAYVGDLSDGFFELLFLYVATNLIGSIAWAQQFDAQEVSVMMTLIERFDQDTDHFTKIVPNWFIYR